MAHLLQEPDAAVDGGKKTCVKAKVDDPLEMAIGRIVFVSGSVPANRDLFGVIRNYFNPGAGWVRVDAGTLDGVSWIHASACSSAD